MVDFEMSYGGSMLIRLVVILCTLTISTAIHATEKRQTGNIIYEPPKDWRVSSSIRKEGWVTIINKRKDERCKYCYIRIHIGAPTKGSFKAWVRKRMKFALDDGKVTKTLPTKVVNQENLGTIHIHTRTIKDRGSEIQMFVAYDLEDRWEMIHFEGEADDLEELTESQATMKEEFLPIIRTISFMSEGAKPVLGDPTPGKLDGTWSGKKISYGMNLDLSTRIDITNVIYTFWPDGRFFKGVPLTGLSKFDPREAVLTTTSKVGNYRIRGGKVVLSYADGRTKSLKLKGDTMRDGNAHLSKVRLAKDGFRFKGTLSNFRYSPFGAGISGGVASSSNWEFFKDGTYESDSFTGASGRFDGGGGFSTSTDPDAKRGRYKVADGLIRLTSPKGAEIVWPFYLDTLTGVEQPVVRGEFLK